MVDTNCNPDPVDYVIPANDDAIRAIKLICARMADAALEGINMRQDSALDSGDDAAAAADDGFDGIDELEDSELLGTSTMAHIESMSEPEEEAPVEEAPAEEAAAEEAPAEEAADAASDEAEEAPASEEAEAAE